jgi:hypothetical protein
VTDLTEAAAMSGYFVAWVDGRPVAGASYQTGTGNVRRIIELNEREVVYDDRLGRAKCPLAVFMRAVSGPG